MIIKCLKGNFCLLCLLLPMVIFLILVEMPNGFVLFCLGRKNCLWRKGKRVMILIVIPCEQWFLSCMAFSIYKVIHVACLSCLGEYKTNQLCNFVNTKSHARDEPLLAGYNIIVNNAQFVNWSELASFNF